MPCTDDAVHQDDITIQTELSISNIHYELCSPFCSDHDCHTHITFGFVNTLFVQHDFSKLHRVEQPQKAPIPFFAIWQPPKIA